MELRIKNRVLPLYNNISVTLRYDAVGDTFSFSYYFQPWNAVMRELLLPLSFHQCTVTHNGETLITGVLFNTASTDGPVKRLRNVGGYSRSGVLEDCCHTSGYQFAGVSLKEIAEEICTPFGLKVVIDKIVAAECDKVYGEEVTIKPDGKIRDFLSELASQRWVVLSHNAAGDLVLTRADTGRAPIYHFEDGGMKGLDISLNCEGQRMHSVISVVSQGTGGENVGDSSIRNPYLKAPVVAMVPGRRPHAVAVWDPNYRPTVEIQTSGDDNDTPKTARYYLGQELKAIQVTIKMYGWEIDGKLVRPNSMVTVKSPENSIYQKTRLFVERVNYSLEKDSLAPVATLTCVVPEVYEDGAVVNIFTGSNLTVPAPVLPGNVATITPFV